MKNKLLYDLRKIIRSRYFLAVLFLISAVTTLLRIETYVALGFVMIISVILIISDDILDTTGPFLLAAVFVSMCYNSYDRFIKFLPLAIIPVFAVIFHFVKYREKLKTGASFGGVCAVAIAVTLGGAFNITSREYFSGSSVYNTIGLGLGMVILYLMMKSQLSAKKENNEENMLRFARLMYLMGVLACIVVLAVYVRDIDIFLSTKRFITFNSRNNFATYLMLAMPFPCYFAIKNRVHLLSLCLFYGCILLTNSRGGLIFGSIELLICFAYILISDKKHRLFYLISYGVLAAVALVGASYVIPMYAERLVNGGLVSTDEPRFLLLVQSFKDFLSAPLFGVGIGYRGNADIYNPKFGGMNWYHMMIPQIVGSMGACGILAYGYQIFGRFKLWIKTRNALTSCLFLSYIGLLLMSQVNPGEFCPIPYGFLAVIIFIFLENEYENKKTPLA